MKRILTILSALLLAATSFAQEENAPASRLSRDSILIGDQVRWTVPVSLKEGEECFIEKPDEPVAPGVETIEGFGIDTLSNRRGKLELEGRMVLTAFDSGSFFLPPVIVAIQRADGAVDTLFYDGPVLEVNTIPVDTATFEPYDIKGQLTYPLTFREVWPWLLAVLALAAVIYVIVRFERNRRDNRDFFGHLKTVDPPHIVALRDLEKIRSQKLWQNGKQKQYWSAITDSLRLYMEGRYDIPALERTTAEIFESLKDKDIDARMLDEVKDLFTTADFVKFAKHSASDEENEEAIPAAVRFVNSTYMQQVEAEKEEEGR